MSNQRRQDGDETWDRLLNWTKGQKASERLSGHILAAEGYKSINPSHPLGGQDGLKDIVCEKKNKKWVAASYFPRGEKSFKDIKKKYLDDLKGCDINDIPNFIFITNQYLTLANRKSLKKVSSVDDVEIYHLEQITHILDSQENYGVRLQFLGIKMTKEEQLAFFATMKNEVSDLRKYIVKLSSNIKESNYSESFIEELDHIENRMTSISMMLPMSNLSYSIKDISTELDLLDNRLNDFFILDPIYSLSNRIEELMIKISTVESNLLSLSTYNINEYEQTLDRIIEKLNYIQRVDPKN